MMTSFILMTKIACWSFPAFLPPVTRLSCSSVSSTSPALVVFTRSSVDEIVAFLLLGSILSVLMVCSQYFVDTFVRSKLSLRTSSVGRDSFGFVVNQGDVSLLYCP